MANTYTQIHIQAVFAVQNRNALINVTWEDELYKYITGIIQNNGHKVLAINGMPDHIHVLFGMRPVQSLSDLIKAVKQDSSKWINTKGFVKGKFSWQAGYGAFSYRKADVPTIINYIRNQKKHHKKTNLQEEYLSMLKEFDVSYDDRYIFKPLE